MEIQEIRQMSDQEILDAIDDVHEERWKLRFQQATGELKNTNLMSQNRRKLARLKTVLGERQAQAGSNKEKNNG
jgi:large subunit ribosomal protein L29